jgi:hypothetical protein
MKTRDIVDKVRRASHAPPRRDVSNRRGTDNEITKTRPRKNIETNLRGDIVTDRRF